MQSPDNHGGTEKICLLMLLDLTQSLLSLKPTRVTEVPLLIPINN